MHACMQVAAELLQEFVRCFRLPPHLAAPEALAYAEAHKWSNAYPLNPRAPGGLEGADGEGLAGVAQEKGLAGSFMLARSMHLGACGDW